MANEVKLKLSIDGDQAVMSAMDRVKGSMSGVSDAAATMGSAMRMVTAALSVGAVAAWAKSTIDAADAMNDLSQQVGIAVRDLAKYELAANQSGTSMQAIAKGIKALSGNLMEHGSALKEAGIDATSADGAMKQLADVFAGMPDSMEKTTLATKMFGKAGMELIPMLNLGSQGLQDAADKSAKYALQMAAMAPLADAFNDNMAEIALSSKVMGMSLLNDALPALVKITQAMADASLKGGTLSGIMAGLSAGFENYKSDVGNYWQNVGAGKGVFGSLLAGAPSTGGATGEWGDPNPKTDSTDAWLAKYKAMMAAIKGDGDGGAAKKALADINREFEAQARLLAELAGLSGSFEQDWGRLSARYKANKLDLQGLTAAQAALLAKQPAIQAQTKAQADASKEAAKADELAFKAMDDLRIASEKQITTASTMLDQIEFETRLLDLNTESRAIATMERELERQGIVKGTQAYDGYIAKLREAMAIKTGKEAGIKAADDMREAWRKTAESIRDNLTDAFMQAIDGTKSLWVSLRDSVVGMFKNMVLRPVIQGVVGAGVSAVAGSAAASAMGFGSSAAGAAAGASMSGGITSLLGSSGMGALDIMGFDPTTLAIGAAILVLSQMGGKFISAADSGRARVDYSATGLGGAAYSTTGDAAQIANATTNANALAKTYFDTAASLGVKAIASAFEFGTNTGKEGASPMTVIGVNAGSGSYSSGEIASGDAAALQLASSRAILTALQASDMPRYLAGVFDNITATTATQDQITAALASAGALATFNNELLSLPFANLAALSYSATQSLIKFSGGLDKLQANLGTYYSNFYSTEEQRAQTIANINKATAGSGLDAATATRESFRRIVEAQDLSTESGRAMYAALISVSGAFAGLTPVLDSVAATVATVATTVDALQVAMARAQNANALADSAMAALTASIDAEKSSLNSKYESDLSKLTAAQDAYTQSVTDSISSVADSVSKLQSLSNRLRSSLTNTLIGTDGQQRRSAQALIAAVLATARTGGGLPKDTTALESALSTVAKPSEKLFGSFEDYARDFYKTSNDIATLSGITDTTLTAQQAMLAQLEAQSAISKAAYSSQSKLLKDQYDQAVKGLDTTLASAQKQLDALHGIDTSVLSVSAAIDRLAAALGAAKTTQTTSDAVTDDTIRGYIANLKAGGGTEADMVVTLAKRSKEVGVTQSDLARAMGMTETDVNDYFASFGIPKFDVGTNYVPYDMVAQIHEGEAIVPKAYNPAANNGNGETAAALRALADRLDRIEANTRATAGHTAGTDRKLARVIPGNALITEAAV